MRDRLGSLKARLGLFFIMTGMVACVAGGSDDAPGSTTNSAATGATRRLSLKVQDKGTHRGLGGAAVRVVDDATHRVVSTKTTDAEGRALVDLPAQGRYTLSTIHRGHSLGITGLDVARLPEGEMFVEIDPLQAITSAARMNGAPGNANVDRELGLAVVPSSGSTTTTLFYVQGPNVAGDRYPVALFGGPNRTYDVVEIDPATLRPIVSTVATARADGSGVYDHELSGPGRGLMGAQGVLLAVDLREAGASDPSPTLEPAAPSPAAPSGSVSPKDVTVPVNGGGSVGIGQGFPDTCGPPGATCVQYTQTTGNVQDFCPPATNAPYCSVSFSASVSAAINAQPFGVGVTITGTATVGAGINVYPTGTGTFECKVRATACAWAQPGIWVARQGWGICLNYLPPPLGPTYPCWTVYNVWVPQPCGGGGVTYPNLGLANGVCTCFNWSASMDKIKECPGADAGTKDAAVANVEEQP